MNRYWGKIPEAELESALALIDHSGWNAFEEQYKGRLDFTTEENRADWRFFVPLNRESVVLDAGAGLGRISIPLARVAGKVIACDASVVRMQFLKKFAEAKGLDNIETVHADLFNLPYAEGSFDLIVMNGVLEWVGRTPLYTNPRKAQHEALRICRKLLKKGGVLYVGIENRFAASYLRGIDHSGLRYTSYMPRLFAQWYTRIRTGHSYDTYTYTKRGYEKLFAEAGFDQVDIYLVYPGYNLPRLLIPYNCIRLLQYTLTHLLPRNTFMRKVGAWAGRSALMMRLYRWVFFSFAIFVRK